MSLKRKHHINMETTNNNNPLELVFHNDLQQYLFSIGRIDGHFPE